MSVLLYMKKKKKFSCLLRHRGRGGLRALVDMSAKNVLFFLLSFPQLGMPESYISVIPLKKYERSM